MPWFIDIILGAALVLFVVNVVPEVPKKPGK